MEEIFIYEPESRKPIWWFLLTDLQKKQHIFIDSELTLKQIKLVLKIYGEEEIIKTKDNQDS